MYHKEQTHHYKVIQKEHAVLCSSAIISKSLTHKQVHHCNHVQSSDSRYQCLYFLNQLAESLCNQAKIYIIIIIRINTSITISVGE